MTEIILIRHGETEWNVEEVFRGRIDIELNQNGIKQAKLLAEYLSKRKIDAIYSSPLQRAVKTAEIIAGYHKLNVGIAPGLIDFDFGEWQGLSLQEVRDRFKFLAYAPIITLSAESHKRVDKLYDMILEINENYSQRIKTSELNEVLERAMRRHHLPSMHGQIIKIYYAPYRLDIQVL